MVDTGIGIRIRNGATNTSITNNNIVSGNDATGIQIISSSDNTIADNFIGVARNGVGPLGNGGNGVHVLASSFNAQDNVIGGSESGANTIAYNGGYGVFLRGRRQCRRTTITYNSIFNNTQGGIEFDGSENGGIAGPLCRIF